MYDDILTAKPYIRLVTMNYIIIFSCNQIITSMTGQHW